MLFLVELDGVKSGATLTPEAGRAFIEQVIFPTLARGQQLVAETKILAGGAVVGRIALRFIVEADSSEEVDRLISSFPLWPVADTRVTPLITFAERRNHVQALLEHLARQSQRQAEPQEKSS
jgi:muconolactone delta-isomerase